MHRAASRRGEVPGGGGGGPEVVVGLVAAPGAPAELAGRLATELPGELSARFSEVRWRDRGDRVLPLYGALFLLARAGGLLLVVPTLFAAGLGHAVHLSDYLELAWLTSSPGTVGGALGAGLESDEAVCTYRSEHSGSDPVRVGSGG